MKLSLEEKISNESNFTFDTDRIQQVCEISIDMLHMRTNYFFVLHTSMRYILTENI